MLKHYVEYRMISEERITVEVAGRNIEKIKIPDNCLGFRYFDRSVTVIAGETLTGDKKNLSGWYYLGEEMTLNQVKDEYGDDDDYKIFILNMENNGYRIVKTKSGKLIPLGVNDKIIQY